MITDRLYIWRIEEFRERVRSRKPNEIWVTELISCPLKMLYLKQYPEIAEASAFTPITIWGELTHRGFEEVLKELFPPEEIVTEVEISKEVSINNKKYIIKGRVDAIYKDVIIELKTARSDFNIPHEHHFLQLKIYLWITGKRKGVLLYVTPERIAEYEVLPDLTDKDILGFVKDLISIQKTPRYDWECKYCPYSKLCPKKISD